MAKQFQRIVDNHGPHRRHRPVPARARPGLDQRRRAQPRPVGGGRQPAPQAAGARPGRAPAAPDHAPPACDARRRCAGRAGAGAGRGPGGAHQRPGPGRQRDRRDPAGDDLGLVRSTLCIAAGARVPGAASAGAAEPQSQRPDARPGQRRLRPGDPHRRAGRFQPGRAQARAEPARAVRLAGLPAPAWRAAHAAGTGRARLRAAGRQPGPSGRVADGDGAGRRSRGARAGPHREQLRRSGARCRRRRAGYRPAFDLACLGRSAQRAAAGGAAGLPDRRDRHLRGDAATTAGAAAGAGVRRLHGEAVGAGVAEGEGFAPF